LQSDNAVALWAELDLAAINIDAHELGPDFDVDLLGIEGFSLTEVEKVEPGCDEDEVPEAPEPKTKRGDIYKLGRHRLMCGDSTSIDDVEKLMAGEKADLWIADPPFGVSYIEKNAAVNRGVPKSQIGKEIKSDTKTLEEISPLWRETAVNAFIVTTDKAANYWCACQGIDKMMMMMMMMMQEAGWNTRHQLIWVKSKLVFGRSDYHYRHEPIIYGWKKKNTHNWYGDRKQDSVLEFDKPNRSDLHPTTKPVELFERLFSNSSKPGDLIFESFGGSGTTLIAAEKLDRRSNTMELDPKYCDVIVARWEKYTGKKAELLNG
jgi:site-specific DNA-methyltransferase (adenine-specific)